MENDAGCTGKRGEIHILGPCLGGFAWLSFPTQSAITKRKAYTIYCYCVLLSQFVYVWAIHSQVSSDAYVIAYIAYHFAAGEFDALEGWWMDYLAVYPNNLPATEVVTLVFSVWLPDTLEQAWLLLSGVAALLSDLALVLFINL